MHRSVGLLLSVVCSLTMLACGRQQLDDPGGIGSANAKGSTGSAGALGGTGTAGATNASGAAGATIVTGSAGATTVTGSAGATNATGAAGATNATGSAGATGSGGTTMVSGRGKLFDVCLVQSDCSAGLECYCGICTTPCMPGGCTGLPIVATCPDTVPWTSACTGLPLQSECAIECLADSDCRELGPTGVCTAGWCRRPLLVSIVNGSVVTCADRTADMKAQLDPIVASADRVCMTDADCVQAPLWNACYGDGCGGAAVNASGASAIAAELTTLQNQGCDAAFRAGCVGVGTSRCPEEGGPACVANECKIVGPIRGP
jgi:hypothetical protein